MLLGPMAWKRVGHLELIFQVNLASQNPIYVTKSLQIKTLQASCG